MPPKTGDKSALRFKSKLSMLTAPDSTAYKSSTPRGDDPRPLSLSSAPPFTATPGHTASHSQPSQHQQPAAHHQLSSHTISTTSTPGPTQNDSKLNHLSPTSNSASRSHTQHLSNISKDTVSSGHSSNNSCFTSRLPTDLSAADSASKQLLKTSLSAPDGTTSAPPSTTRDGSPQAANAVKNLHDVFDSAAASTGLHPQQQQQQGTAAAQQGNAPHATAADSGRSPQSNAPPASGGITTSPDSNMSSAAVMCPAVVGTGRMVAGKLEGSYGGPVGLAELMKGAGLEESYMAALAGAVPAQLRGFVSVLELLGKGEEQRRDVQVACREVERVVTDVFGDAEVAEGAHMSPSSHIAVPVLLLLLQSMLAAKGDTYLYQNMMSTSGMQHNHTRPNYWKKMFLILMGILCLAAWSSLLVMLTANIVLGVMSMDTWGYE